MSQTGISPDRAIVTWRGIQLEEMSKQELIDAIRILGKMWDDSCDNHARTFRMWEICRKARR